MQAPNPRGNPGGIDVCMYISCVSLDSSEAGQIHIRHIDEKRGNFINKMYTYCIHGRDPEKLNNSPRLFRSHV